LWINENITETNFVNMDEVYTKWNHIKLLVSMKYTKFGAIKEFITTTPVDLVKIKIGEWFPDRNIGTNSDPCIDDLIECSDGADEAYINYMRSPIGWTETESESNRRQAQADVIYEFMQ